MENTSLSVFKIIKGGVIAIPDGMRNRSPQVIRIFALKSISLDSLTQIVLGAAVGEATLGKKAGNKALLYGAIAGTIPDLDIIANFFTDTITAIEVHRGFSHSIVFSMLMAPPLGWLANKIESKTDLGWKPWATLFFWGLFTHPLLDAFTTWGTRLFWPLDLRLAFNSIFVIDPFYTAPFLICTLLVLFLKGVPKSDEG